ncbi:MAG: polysaccharide biosynthesis transport protein [Acidobacteriota bacterium]|jgi:capsular exopolysaccharide synthesis family protein|nr:polysaccharide biosynthesis transport protein [Acidobacteriota bacterium]
MRDTKELAAEKDALVPRAAYAEAELSENMFPPLPGYGNPAASGETIPLRDYWRSVRKRLWLVITVTLLATTLVLLYMARKPDIYEAQARVQVDLEGASPARGAFKNSPIVFNNALNDVSYFNTQMENLSSQGLLLRVVKTLDLEHNPNFLRAPAQRNSSTWQNLLRMVGLGKKDGDAGKGDIPKEALIPDTLAPAPNQVDVEEAARLAPYVLSLQRSLTVKQVNATRLIKVTYEHHDPVVAAKVVNALMNAFMLSNLEMKTETSSTTGEFLQRRIAELQSQIRANEEQLLNYAKSNQILSLDEHQNTVVDRLVGLNQQLLQAENERKLAEAAYRAAQRPGAAEALSDESGKQIADTETKLAELRARRAELLVENTEEWPEVKEVSEQIAVLEKQVQGARGRATSTVLTNLETRYKQALAREQALRASFDQQRGETLTQNEAAVNYRIIQQEIATNKNLLDGLLQRSKENDVELAGTANNIHVKEYALMPLTPVGPRRLLAVSLALVLSLTSGVFLALFLEYLDDTVRSTEDVETMLHLPTLAVIPSIGAFARRRLFPARKALPSANGNGDSRSELLIVNNDTRSALAEAYRHLRTSILLSTPGRAPRSLLVTSSLPSEGKTTTTLNTAASLAQTSGSVLLVDADMRRPRLHTLLGLPNGRGLSTILSSRMSEAEVMSMVQRHEGSGLYLLPSGPIPPNPAELIASEQMRALIKTLEGSFAHIVVDSPPIASFTDGVLISSLVDGVLLVVHGGKSARSVVRRSRQLLIDVGAKVFGVVLNKVSITSSDYYYYQYQSQGYYAGEEGGPETLPSQS